MTASGAAQGRRLERLDLHRKRHFSIHVSTTRIEMAPFHTYRGSRRRSLREGQFD